MGNFPFVSVQPRFILQALCVPGLILAVSDRKPSKTSSPFLKEFTIQELELLARKEGERGKPVKKVTA